MKYYKFKEKKQRNLTIGKIICLARTYKKHAEEMNANITKDPVLFLKPNSSVIFDKETIIIPKLSKNVHHEVELGIVIGKKGKNIRKNDATNHVLGYLLGLDITARDMQSEAKRKGLPWSISKGFDTFTPISNVILKEKISNINNLDICLKVNGEIRQESNTKFMIYSIEEIIEFVSRIFTLEEGDLILTGTPEGVSEIKDGDLVEATIDNSFSLKLNVKNEI